MIESEYCSFANARLEYLTFYKTEDDRIIGSACGYSAPGLFMHCRVRSRASPVTSITPFDDCQLTDLRQIDGHLSCGSMRSFITMLNKAWSYSTGKWVFDEQKRRFFSIFCFQQGSRACAQEGRREHAEWRTTF